MSSVPDRFKSPATSFYQNAFVFPRTLDDPQQSSRVPVYIRVLDVNDNPPKLASFYETFVCENAKAGQVNSGFSIRYQLYLPRCQF